jgi:hypothetical protein
MNTDNLTNKELDACIEKYTGVQFPPSLRKTGTNKRQKKDIIKWLETIVDNTISWTKEAKP